MVQSVRGGVLGIVAWVSKYDFFVSSAGLEPVRFSGLRRRFFRLCDTHLELDARTWELVYITHKDKLSFLGHLCDVSLFEVVFCTVEGGEVKSDGADCLLVADHSE